ncbi:hypothetical protein [Halegenticoccus tardaugens]|uniref:hypothetical protein n=1 Tax=Halegenticoccus tardaugens TaxID=2071624 RepID=UPI00100A6C2B|nr:hypothetical protein [Halegenticoccus tardaugens]
MRGLTVDEVRELARHLGIDVQADELAAVGEAIGSLLDGATAIPDVTESVAAECHVSRTWREP